VLHWRIPAASNLLQAAFPKYNCVNGDESRHPSALSFSRAGFIRLPERNIRIGAEEKQLTMEALSLLHWILVLTRFWCKQNWRSNDEVVSLKLWGTV
jgi:hypothetical protein